MPSEFILTQDGSNPSAPAANEVSLFTKAGGIYAINNAGSVKDLSIMNDLVILEHNVASAVNGGSAAAAVWETRPVTTIDIDTAGICTLAANQFVLPAGTYDFQIVTSHYFTNRTRVRLFNVTDSIMIKASVTPILPTGTSGLITLIGRFTLTTAKILSIQQYAQAASATYGMGVAANIAGINEIHLQAAFRRVAL